MTDVVEQLAALVAKRGGATRRIGELEAEQRIAVGEREAARTSLIEFERQGGTAAKRTQLERELATAETKAVERWPERIEGAKRAASDAAQRVQQFAAANLAALVQDKERQGEAAAADVTRHAEELWQAFTRREAIAAEINRSSCRHSRGACCFASQSRSFIATSTTASSGRTTTTS